MANSASYPAGGPPSVQGLVSSGLGGLYQINTVVPSVAAGEQTVLVSVARQSSQPQVTLWVASASATIGPTPVPIGVVNAASYAKTSSESGAAVGPGSLIQIYSSISGAQQGVAGSPPWPTLLGGVNVSFDGIPGAVQSVSPSGSLLNVQIPYEVTGSSASMVLSVNGVPSAPVEVPMVPQAPGVFTVPPDGQHNAIFVYVDPSDNTAKVAASSSQSGLFGFPTAPVPRGTAGLFYATGLGLLTPPVADGAAPSPTDTTLHDANLMPSALVGGVKAQVLFAGQAPGYPGVGQINIVIPANAPTGDAVSLQLMSADGTVLSTAGATIAVQ